MSDIVFLVEDAPEGGFTARALGHSVYTDGETFDELRTNVRDAVRCHFETNDELACDYREAEVKEVQWQAHHP